MAKNSMTNVGDYSIWCYPSQAEWKENTFLVMHNPTRDAFIIDPGSEDQINEAISDCSPFYLRYILLTHGHYDHMGGVAFLNDQFNISCQIHTADLRVLKNAPLIALRFSSIKIRDPQLIEVFTGESNFQFNGIPIRVVHLPGHTPGSVGFLFPGFVFSGDTLMYQKTGPTNFPGADKKLLLLSIQNLLNLVSEEDLIFSGHGRPWNASDALVWWRDFSHNTVQ